MDNSAENSPIPTTHPQYRQIALIIYLGVLFIGIYDHFVGRPPTSPIELSSDIRLAIFCVAVLLMCLLEEIHQRRISTRPISPIVHLVSTMLLAGCALAVSNQNYSQLLLLTPVLFAEVTFQRWVSVLTALAAVFLIFLRTSFTEDRISMSLLDLQNLAIFTVLLLLIWLMARLIKNEWSNRLNLQSLHNELKESSTQLAQMAVVNERNRMARDIHDSVGHHLAAVSIQLEMASKLHQREPNASIEAIKEAQAAAHDALQDVRQSVGTLRESAETFELAPAVELLISRIANENLAVNYRLDGDETLYPQPARIVFFRAVQEGLTNVYKHATATHVKLWLQFLPKQARLRIIDDGVGFDTKQSTSGTGLQGVRERVEQLGGSVVIESRPDEGTVLDIVLPQVTL